MAQPEQLEDLIRRLRAVLIQDVDRQAEDFRLFLESFWEERRRAAKEARR